MDNENNNNETENKFINKPKEELDVNKKKREDYEQLMKESSTNLDGYYDKNNMFVKIFLFVLLVIIAVGSFIVISTYLSTK